MNNEKVYLKGYVVGHSADTLGYKGLQIQLENMDIVEVDESLVYRNIDEPQKPVVPQFVADWIKYCKNTGVSFARALMVYEVDFYNYANQEDHSKLMIFLESMINQELFARAWLDGYTVEENKKYIVKINNVFENASYLNHSFMNKRWIFADILETDDCKTKHTRKELEEAGFGDVFNSPLFEVEEVE